MTYQIVTDSGARFVNAHLLQEYPIVTVPYALRIGSRLYREGQDLSADEVLQLVQARSSTPQLVAPGVEEYKAVYRRAAQSYEHVISIHTSREMNDSWKNARLAAQQMGPSISVGLIDTRTTCVGQGLLVRMAAELAAQKVPFEEAVQRVRTAADNIYSLFLVESFERLHHNEILSTAHATLGELLEIKPLVTMDEGYPVVTGKVRTRTQALDRLVEFAEEFDNIQDGVIIQARTHITEQTRTLQDRLSVSFPGKHFPYTIYGASLGSLLGGSVTGIVILENPLEGEEDDEDKSYYR
ncbi:MAG: DegV family protein [Anaerolineae bacterium]|nr:DegV family protein [Anaerolineae bacterium]